MPGALLGAVFGTIFAAVSGIMYFSVFLVWFVLTVIGRWMMFSKAGQPGWKSVIPIYSDYISYKIAWTPNMFWLYFVLYFLGDILERGAEGNVWGIIGTLGTLCSAATVVIAFLYSFNLAKSFGKGVLFAVGLWIFEPLFTIILGFGSARYEKRYW